MATDFDERAATWDDDPAKVERARVVAEAIRRAVPLAPSTRLLEYGAGTGLVSQALMGHVGPLTLAEPSAGMRDVMAEKVATGRLPAMARIVDLDLATAPQRGDGRVVAGPEDQADLVVTVMTLHHIDDVDTVLAGLARLLAPGGHLCIVDLEKEDGSFHRDDPAFGGHHGFGRAELTGRLARAGFADIAFRRCHEMQKDGRTYPLFLATCTPAGRTA